MTVNEAKEKIVYAISTAKDTLDTKNFITTARIYYTDANFIESSELTPKTRFVFGELTIGYDGLEDGDECIYAICAPISSGEIDATELDRDITDFASDIDKFIAETESAPSVISAIERINAKQETEAKEATEQMMAEIRKTKKKLFLAFGALILIIAAVLIGNALV